MAGSGSIAAKEKFKLTEAGGALPGTAGGIPNEVFQMDNLVSFVIGLGLMWAGFDVTMRIAEKMPGRNSSSKLP